MAMIQLMIHDLWQEQRKKEKSKGTAESYLVRNNVEHLESAGATVDWNSELLEDEEYRRNAENFIIPEFEGMNPVHWIILAEKYFEINCTKADRKVPLASMYMRGKTVYWLKMLKHRMPCLDWEMLKRELLFLYGGQSASNPYESLSTL